MPRKIPNAIPVLIGDNEYVYRPAGEMPKSDHIIAGRILKTVLAAPLAPKLAKDHLDFVRENLTDWMCGELDDSTNPVEDATGVALLDVYDGPPDTEGPYAEAARSLSGIMKILQQLKALLDAAYPDCSPLGEELANIGRAIDAVEELDL